MEIEQQVQTQQQQKQQKPLFEIKQYNALAFWLPKGGVAEKCAICKFELLDMCVDCKANPKTSSAIDCKAVEGQCSHQFHQHCIQRWTKTNPQCPLDNGSWQVNKVIGK